jgi:uncharacterized SAM-binding protein YcdF (DUF218 family)
VKRKLLWFIVLFFFLFCVLLTGIMWFFRDEIYYFLISRLIVSDTLEKCDCVVALGGEKIRKNEAVRLFREGYGKKIIFTGFEVTKDDYERYGLNKSEYIYPVKNAFNTYEEAMVVKEVAKKYNFQSVMIVTSFYHSRRASETFKNILGKENIRVIIHPVFWKNFDIKDWTKNSYLRKAVIIEWLGIYYYRFEYF